MGANRKDGTYCVAGMMVKGKENGTYGASFFF